MELDELISFMIQERLNVFGKIKSDEKAREDREKCDEWEKLLQTEAPELAEKNEEYMNWLMLSQGSELEEAYKFGFADGVRLMKRITEIV